MYLGKITNHNLEYNKQAYSAKVANTNSMQESIHASIAVRPSALGVLVVTVLKMLTNTRKSVTSNAIRPVWEIRGVFTNYVDKMRYTV